MGRGKMISLRWAQKECCVGAPLDVQPGNLSDGHASALLWLTRPRAVPPGRRVSCGGAVWVMGVGGAAGCGEAQLGAEGGGFRVGCRARHKEPAAGMC